MTTQREGVQALEASGALDDLYAKIDAGEVRLDDMIVSLYAGGTTRKPSLPLPVPVPPLVPANKLNGLERARILDVVNSPDYVDLPPIQIYARLLDRGVYLASISTIYRVLAENKQVKERRRLARHPAGAIPELAVEMMKETFGIHGTPHVVHADRGTSMTSKTVAALLSDLEVTKSHSRPHVCLLTG